MSRTPVTIAGAGAGFAQILARGLSSSAFDPFATSEFFSELESLHVQLFERPECPLADAAVMIEVLAASYCAAPMKACG
jgi:hypothetical protein